MKSDIKWLHGAAQSRSSAAASIARELEVEERLYEEEPAPEATSIPTTPVSGWLPSVGAVDSVKLWAFRIIAVFSSLACSLTSMYFSNLWFRDSQPEFIAAVMSATIVSTLTIAPELAILLVRKRHIITAVIVMFIWIIATTFSMSSTIGGIYNARTKTLKEEVLIGKDEYSSQAAGRSADLQVRVLQDRISRLSTSLEADRKQVATYSAQIDAALARGDSPTQKSMAILVANRNVALVRIGSGEKSIQEAEAEIIKISVVVSNYEAGSGDILQKRDFNTFLGERLGASPPAIEFALAVFPAIFIDIIAPAMLVVAFSL